MKPIFIAGATVLAASSAFGFAKAVDHLAADPVVAQPAPGISAERHPPEISAHPQRRMSPQNAPVATVMALPHAMDDLPAAPAVDDGDTTPEAAAGAMAALDPAMTTEGLAPNYFVAPFGAVPSAAPMVNAAAAPGVTQAGATSPHRFENLPMVGVYR